MSAGNGRTMLTGNKLISRQEKDGVTEFIIETGSKLGEVFTELPSGIVNKTETGVGATTLELNAHRDSIIVEPTRITASTKAHEHNALYVGSATLLHTKTSNLDIKAYLNDKTVKFKKIIVVADSLDRVIGSIEPSKLKDFFLMIDEADAFQIDSSFRTSMENCIDIYKSFPKDRRALVTATMLDFSDPELEQEDKTVIKYERPVKRDINLIHTPDLHGYAADFLTKMLSKYPSEKILVAYNNVKGCFELAQHLVTNKVIKDDEVKILCSVANKTNAQQFYSELHGQTLPGKVNFLTSAYYSGFDIKEKFHLLSLSGNGTVFSLSEHRFKQIAGRGRNGLYSETIIYTLTNTNINLPYTKDQLIAAAEQERKALECVERNFSTSPVLKEQIMDIRKIIVDSTGLDGIPFLRKDKQGVYQISYLNIDACLENQRYKRELYNNATSLPEKLAQEGHNVKHTIRSSSTNVISYDSQNSMKSQVQEIVDILKKLNPQDDLKAILASKNWHPRVKMVVKWYKKYFLYIDNNQWLDFLEQEGKKSDSRGLNNLLRGAFFAAVIESNLYKRSVRANLKIGQAYTPQDLLIIWNRIFQDSGLFWKLKSPTQAVRMTNTHFLVTKDKRSKTHKLISENPYQFRIIKSIPEKLSMRDMLPDNMIF